jgi:preprotein translocase SecE subunit
MNKIKQYFKESIQDFNAVTWPTKKQAIRISTIVFIFMVASAIVLGAADQLLADGYKMLLSLSI